MQEHTEKAPLFKPCLVHLWHTALHEPVQPAFSENYAPVRSDKSVGRILMPTLPGHGVNVEMT